MNGNRVEWKDVPPPGIEPRPQVPETCVISISPRGHGGYSITYQRRSNYGEAGSVRKAGNGQAGVLSGEYNG